MIGNACRVLHEGPCEQSPYDRPAWSTLPARFHAGYVPQRELSLADSGGPHTLRCREARERGNEVSLCCPYRNLPPRAGSCPPGLYMIASARRSPGPADPPRLAARQPPVLAA